MPAIVDLHAGLEVGGVGFVRVDVHRQAEVRIHADAHVAEHQFAVARHAHADGGFVLDAVAERVGGRHVDMAQSRR